MQKPDTLQRCIGNVKMDFQVTNESLVTAPAT